MKLYTLLSSIIAICFFSVAVYKFFSKSKESKSKTISISLIIGAIAFTVLAIVLDFTDTLLTTPITTDVYQKIGPYGDLIGGLVNPVIAFIGVMAASLAFYAQFEANKQVQEQFKIQKFESQFYEMLRMHRENLNEMLIEGYKFEYNHLASGKYAKLDSKKEKNTSGKKIFVTMLNEFHAIHMICKKIFYSYHGNTNINLLTPEAKQLIFDHAYYVFFTGISFYSKNIGRYVKKDITGLLSNELLERYISELKYLQGQHVEKGIKEHHLYILKINVRLRIFHSSTLRLSFNYKPFSGHQSRLAHYYRHLIQTVKFVVKQDESLLTYEEKRDYLRILRATLSNHEQILLYYNWLAGFGTSWEKKLENEFISKTYNDKENKFFTDYRMIHNIPDNLVLNDFKVEKIFDIKYQNFRYERGRRKSDTLFEIMGIESARK